MNVIVTQGSMSALWRFNRRFLLIGWLLGVSLWVGTADSQTLEATPNEFSLGNQSAFSEVEPFVFGVKAKAAASFENDLLNSVTFELYRGREVTAFLAKAETVLALWRKTLGGVNIVSSQHESGQELNEEAFLKDVSTLFQTAKNQSLMYQSTHLATSDFFVDLQPSAQPAEKRWHLSLAYHSFSDEYALILYLDLPTAKARTAEAVVRLQAL